ncbi:MAG: hypothetical protein HY564_02390 [Candidatus Jacksonbacteria bacterium]|nr:hypothetical protein [Candidatus Jacksonbacteria bacterium]
MKHVFATLLENARQNTGELSLHISKYDENLGELVIFLDINDAGEETKKIIKHIIEDSEYHYFHSIAAEPEKALEDGLQKINLGISETLKHTKKDWLPHSSILIAACLKGEVHFAKVGQISVFLVSTGNGTPEIIQITDAALGESVSPIKAFSNIYSGHLPNDAAMLFVTDSILDYVSQEKLRKISQNNDLKHAMEELKILLKKAPEMKKFGAVISRITDDNDAKLAETQLPAKKDKIIKPALAQLKTPAKPKKNEIFEEQKETSKQTPRQYEKPVRGEKSPMNKKIVLSIGILVIALILILAGVKLAGVKNSGPYSPSDKEKAIAVPTFDESAAEVQAKFVEAQNFLIADNKVEAKSALEQARALIVGLSEDTPERASQKQLLSKKVEIQILLTEGVGLNVPTLLTELKGISGDELIKKGDTLFLIDAENGSVYQIPVFAPQPVKLEITTSGEIGPLVKTIDETGETIIFYHELGGLAELNVSKKTMKAIEWNRGWKEAPLASDIYQNKLYVLAQEGKIFKYARAITGFTQETLWLKEGTAISFDRTADMAIDGTIWVLKNNGDILKLFKGAQESFTFSISPALKTPAKLFTDLDLKNLYILDPGTNRIVILGKDGKVIAQFTAEEFSRIKDFAVDESEKKIYVLDEEAVFTVKF